MKLFFRLLALLLVVSGCALAQQPVNDVAINGTAYATGNGTQAGGGVQRVAIASDNTAFTVNAAESGTWSVNIKGNAGASMDVAIGGGTAATDALQIAGVYNSSPPSLSSGQGAAAQLDSSGNLKVNCTSGCSASSTISLVPQTSGGLSAKHFVAAASDNATNLKGSAGQVYSIDIYNNAAYPVYFKLYNSASSPTGCAATNLFKVVGVQSGTQHILQSEEGWALGTGIGYCLTKGIADSDDTAVLISDATVDLGYK